MARLEEEKKKKKKGCERKKISGRNTEKRMPPLPPLHPPPPRPPRSRTESEWIALLLRGGEERLQDLRENRSSPRVLKLFYELAGKKERNSLSPSLICRATGTLGAYSRNESSSLELIEIFPPLPVIRNIFPSFPQSRRFYYYRSLEITAFETHLHVPSSSLPVRRTRAYLIMTAIEISVRTGDTIINYAAIIVRHFVV